MPLLLAGLAALLAAAWLPAQADSGREIRQILRHGPWPPPLTPDPSNRLSGRPAAIALGQRLFFDPRLSADGRIACASCHDPARGWSDGRTRALGLAATDRNTPGLADVRFHRWFGWDGGADSIWAQAIRALLDEREMGVRPERVADLLARDADLACLAGAADGGVPAAGEGALVLAAKAIAAFVETLVSPPAPFDRFRDALARGDEAAAAYPAAARRGLSLFLRSGCADCHFGPLFSNGEFGDIGVPHMAAPGRVDPGRHGGIERLQRDPYSLLGRWSDDAAGTGAGKTRHLRRQHADFGRFKVPSLRNVAHTAPYMHDGSIATLREVVQHYSDLDLDRLHVHGEQLLRPLGLDAAAVDDMVAFLASLSAAPPAPPAPLAVAACAPPPAGEAGRESR